MRRIVIVALVTLAFTYLGVRAADATVSTPSDELARRMLTPEAFEITREVTVRALRQQLEALIQRGLPQAGAPADVVAATGKRLREDLAKELP